MDITERHDGLFEDGTGRLFREVEELEVVLDEPTRIRLEAMSAKSSVPVNDICQAAIVDRLLREDGPASDD